MTVAASEAILQWLETIERETLPNVVQSLLELEKSTRLIDRDVEAEALLGQWQLMLVAGKQSLGKQSHPRTGTILPRWLNIRLTYIQAIDHNNCPNCPSGQIVNQVQVGSLRFVLTGPWKYFSKPQIMAFDFLRLRLSFLGRSLLSLPIRGGQRSEEKFWDGPLKEQAFFRYFWVSPNAIAARGRGGGLALWTKVEEPSDQ